MPGSSRLIKVVTLVTCVLLGVISTLLVWRQTYVAGAPHDVFWQYVAVMTVVGVVAAILFVMLQRTGSFPLALVVIYLGSVSEPAFFISLAAVAIAATSRSLTRTLAAVGVAGLGMLTIVATQVWTPWGLVQADGYVPQSFAMTLLLYSIAAMVGWNVGGSRKVVESLAAKAEMNDVLHKEAAARARVEERSAIAREMHDSLAHDLSLLSLHAGALKSRADLAPEEVSEAAAGIQELAARASADLRATLQAMPGPEGDDELASSWEDLERVLDDCENSGVEAALSIAPGVQPAFEQACPAARRTVVRTVQECLTNARKHAFGQPVRLSIDVADGLFDIVCSNTLRAGDQPALPVTGAGLGLKGLEARIHALGGTLKAGNDSDEFRVEARIPWQKK